VHVPPVQRDRLRPTKTRVSRSKMEHCHRLKKHLELLELNVDTPDTSHREQRPVTVSHW
jgi:hypothetical protein